MQRLNKPAHTSVGTVFFLFLGLAVLPASLKVVGVQFSFSPRLSAAVDAWEQMAQVFGASSQPAGDLSVVREMESPEASPIQSSVSGVGGFVCTRGSESSAETLNDLREKFDQKSAVARRASSPKTQLRNPAAMKRVALVALASLANHTRAVHMLGSLKLETMTIDSLLNGIDRRTMLNFEELAQLRNLPLPISKSPRPSVRVKRVAVSSGKGAESKVFSALDATRRRECDRAALISFPVTSPDYSEF